MNVLAQVQRQRVRFNPDVKEHVQAYRHFLVKRKWENPGCPFELVWPYLSVPDMIKDKIINHYLKI
jgi:hypothetical protein